MNGLLMDITQKMSTWLSQGRSSEVSMTRVCLSILAQFRGVKLEEGKR